MTDIQKLTAFFKWCSIINGTLLVLTIGLFVLVPDFIYRFHGAMFPMARETFDAILYASIGGYKILFLVFNLVPYIALKVVEKCRVE